MKAETFRWPCAITISRATGKVTGVEYAELDAVQVCEYATRLARALDTANELQRARDARAGHEKGGCNNVTFSESAGSC